MEGHAKKCAERYCELANKLIQQLHKVATPCIDTHQFKEEEIGSVGELPKECSQLVLTFDLLHSSHKWIQTILSCGKHSATMYIGIILRFWFCRRLWRFKINIGWNLMHFRKSHVRAEKLDVQETDFSFSQFNRSWDNFSCCGPSNGWYPSSGSLEFGKRSVPLFPKPIQ